MTSSTTTRAALLCLLASIALLLGAAGPAAAQDDEGGGRGGDTSAVAINTKDGSSLFKLAFEIRRVTGDVVDNQNAAVAYASCTECQTVAVSIQVLLVSGSPSTFTPENIAVAINEDCTLCSTVAYAYQFAVGGETKLKLTSVGRREIADLRRELRELGRSDATAAEIKAGVDDITKRLSAVLAREIVPVVKDDDDDDDDDDGEEDDAGEAADPDGGPEGTEAGAPGAAAPSDATGTSGPEGSTPPAAETAPVAPPAPAPEAPAEGTTGP